MQIGHLVEVFHLLAYPCGLLGQYEDVTLDHQRCLTTTSLKRSK